MNTDRSQTEFLLDHLDSLEEIASTILFPPLTTYSNNPVIDQRGFSWFLSGLADPITIAFSEMHLSEEIKETRSGFSKAFKPTVSIFVFPFLAISFLYGFSETINFIIKEGVDKIQPNFLHISLVQFLGAIILFFWIISQYWYWVIFILGKTRIIFKILALLLFIGTLVLHLDLFTSFGKEHNFLLGINHIRDYPFQYILFTIFLFLPTASLIFWLLIKTVIWLFCEVDFFTKRIVKASIDLPAWTINKLMSCDIPDIKNHDNWQLKNVSDQELHLIRKWVSARAEAINQRLIPLTIILGFLALFVNTTTAQGLLEKATRPIVRYFNSQGLSFQEVATLLITIIVFVLIVGISWKNWQLSAVLDLIDEACILVEVKNQVVKQQEKNEKKQTNWHLLQPFLLASIITISSSIWLYLLRKK